MTPCRSPRSSTRSRILGLTAELSAAEIEAVPLIPWTANQTADQMQRFLSSFSSWMALETNVRTDLLHAVGRLIDTKFGGSVDRPFLTAIYTARRL